MNKCCIKEREKIIEELKDKINKIENILKFKNSKEDIESAYNDGITNTIKKILELIDK